MQDPPHMGDIVDFGTVLLFVSGALVLAIGVRLLASRLGIPTAGLLLVAAAAASDLVDRLSTVLSFEDVQRVATLALVVILFEGGSKIGLRRFRGAAVPILALGVVVGLDPRRQLQVVRGHEAEQVTHVLQAALLVVGGEVGDA